MTTKHKRNVTKAAVFGLEQFASIQDTVRFPLLQKKEEKLVHATYHLANKVAVEAGLHPKVYKRLKDKNTVELIE